jgi:TRAP transporter 4TM/12TM fusion protein
MMPPNSAGKRATMSENKLPPRQDEPVVTEEALKKAEQYIEEEEGAINKLPGALGVFTTALAVIMSLFHLYAAYGIMPTHVLRGIHVAFILFLAFLLFPVAKRFRHRVCWWDWLAALFSLVIVCNMLFGGDAFLERAIDPGTWDKILGVALILMVLEAARRTTGWIMPAICVGFLVYAVVGPYLPPPWTHYGMDLGRIVGHMYMTLEGIFGVAIDVSSSLIILFTIYGAFLQYSGAGKFFIDFSFAAMGGKPTGAGRTIVLASFLLGGPSGSGVATTVTLGTVAYPMLMKAGYGKDAAGGLLAAGGLGAIISPPVLGAAAFLIAQFLNISYLDVILMATIPTLLYYFALFLMVEIDARKFGMPNVIIEKHATVGVLTRNYWFHFLSLVAIVFFMVIGFSPVVSVFWATVVAFACSFLHVDCALISYDVLRGRQPLGPGLWNSGLVKALEAGSVGMLSVGATCAAAGLIVGVVTLTGLGLKFSSIVLQYADSGTRLIMSLLGAVGFEQTASLLHDVKLLLTAVMTSLIVWIVGLAVPVTASYIICAVIAAPALIQLGVAGFAAHMFIFYYAVLSEVSPPTALSPFAAAAITGGDPYKTTLQSWKYTMPAFLVPFMFVLDPAGVGLLLMGSFKNLATAPWLDIAVVSVTAMIGIAALAAGVQNWLFKKTTWPERWLLIIAGLALMYPKPFLDYVGIALIVVAIVMHKLRKEGAHAAA